MHKLIEKLAAFFANAVLLTYLAGLFAGTLTFFAGHMIGQDVSLALATAIALSLSVEVHSFLSQRLTRSLWIQVSRTPEGDERDALMVQFKTHFWITVGLVIFSIFNSISFWVVTTHPASAGDWFSVILRGLVIPVAFLAAGFLTKVSHDAADTLAEASHTMLVKTLKTTLKQWNKRLKAAAKQNHDLSPVVVALMEEVGDLASAARIRIIADALAEADGQRALPNPMRAKVRLASTAATTLPKRQPLPSRSSSATTASQNGSSAPETPKTTLKRGRKAKDKRTPAEKRAAVREYIEANGGTGVVSAYSAANAANVSQGLASTVWHEIAGDR